MWTRCLRALSRGWGIRDMPELQDRDTYEELLMIALATASAKVQRTILRALGNPPKLENITPDVWAEIEGAYAGTLIPVLETIYLAGADGMALAIGIGGAYDTTTARAAEWASRYTFDLVRGINDTTRKQLQRYLDDWYRTPQTIGDLQARIAPLFGEQRSRSIAITETTRASVEAERGVARELEGSGVKLKPIHNTSADDKVCPICSPRNQQEITDNVYPPIHVSCRCWASWSSE